MRDGTAAAAMRVLLHAVLAAAVVLVWAAPATACSGYFEMAALRPGAAVFSPDGSVVWVLTDRRSWSRVEADGSSRVLSIRMPLSRMVPGPTDALVVVAQGLMHPSCDVDWHRLDRIEFGMGDAAAGPTGEPVRGGVRTTTPRLHDFPAVWSLGLSPSGHRAAAASNSAFTVVDFPSRRVLHTVEADEAMVAWLDENHLAWVAADGVRVLDVRDGTRTEPTPVPNPLDPSPQASPIGPEALLPGHPSCPHHPRPSMVTILDGDASRLGLTLVAVAGRGCSRWQLLRISFEGEQPRVVPASWAGTGHLLALSASGTRVAVLGNRAVEVLERETGRPLARVTSRWPVIGASFSADGTQLAVASRRPPRPIPRDREPDEDDYDDESDRARGGRGELGVELFSLRTGAGRRVLGRVPPGRLRMVGAR